MVCRSISCGGGLLVVDVSRGDVGIVVVEVERESRCAGGR